MFEIADRLLARIDSGETVAVATAVRITGSAPRTVGTSMALTADGTVIGSISGGCVEGAVFESCTGLLATGTPALHRFGFSDDDAFAVGLGCGGRIEVLVRAIGPGDPVVPALREAASGRRASITTVLSTERLGQIVDDPTACDDLRLFTETSDPPARLIVFGAVEFAVALSNAAAALGYAVTVCDPRSVFATRERFPAAEIVVQWPTEYLAGTDVDERTVICILSHDDRFDADLIDIALRMPVAYVGAMGSRATHARRVVELDRRGIRDLSRLHAPIGLDLGASTPEETAISILAEVLAVRSAATAESLRERTGAIHSAR